MSSYVAVIMKRVYPVEKGTAWRLEDRNAFPLLVEYKVSLTSPVRVLDMTDAPVAIYSVVNTQVWTVQHSCHEAFVDSYNSSCPILKGRKALKSPIRIFTTSRGTQRSILQVVSNVNHQ